MPPTGGGIFGARNGTRTRDPDLGKVVLYQLSYSRNEYPLGVTAFANEAANIAPVRNITSPMPFSSVPFPVSPSV